MPAFQAWNGPLPTRPGPPLADSLQPGRSHARPLALRVGVLRAQPTESRRYGRLENLRYEPGLSTLNY